jgi:hypothetical protein
MRNARIIVSRIMCGAGTHQRFTQDSPILPDVWAEYLERGPDHRVRLLLEPWVEIPPFTVAERMREHAAYLADASQLDD